jgi:hypothetical protein
VKFSLQEVKVSNEAGSSQISLPGVSQTTFDTITSLMTMTDPASMSLLRNLVAHLCFGTEQLAGFPRDPFGSTNGQSPYTSYGAMDTLRAAGSLSDCDMPLALVYWTKRGVQYLDMWSVRRTLVTLPHSSIWPLPISQRRLVEAEAMFLQFQDQINVLVQKTLSQTTLASMHATDYFRYLPAAGLVPLAGADGSRGVDVLGFFAGLTYRKRVFIEGTKLAALMRESLHYAPIDLASMEMIWLYLVRENMAAIDAGVGDLPRPYLIFTSGHIPYQGAARFDVSRWGYSNYASALAH